MTIVPLCILLEAHNDPFLEAFDQLLVAYSLKELLFYFFKSVVEERSPPHQHESSGVVSKSYCSIRVNSIVL